MPDRFFFADEAGDFEFSRKNNVSKHFILCTVCMEDCDVGAALLALRRRLAWADEDIGPFFHASTDKQVVRDQVYEVLLGHKFKVQATIMEKSKAEPQVRVSRPRFYQYGWLYHFRHGGSPLIYPNTEALITTASLGTKKERKSFESAVNDVMSQTVRAKRWKTNFCPANADPCLQVADYCAWAIQRKWERDDTRSYDLIKDRVTYEYDLWRRGQKHYY